MVTKRSTKLGVNVGENEFDTSVFFPANKIRVWRIEDTNYCLTKKKFALTSQHVFSIRVDRWNHELSYVICFNVQSIHRQRRPGRL